MRTMTILLICVGCGNLTESGRDGGYGWDSPAPPLPFEFGPADGTTGVAPDELGYVAFGEQTTPQQQTAITQSLSLVTLPGQQDVPVSGTWTEDRRTFLIATESQVAEGWYMLTLREVPGVPLVPPASYTRRAFNPSTGGWASRFRVGSAPALRAVRFCSDNYILFAFSEDAFLPLDADPAGGITIVQNGSTLACDQPSNQNTATLHVWCTYDRGQPVTIVIGRSLASPSGVPVAPPTEGRLEYTFPAPNNLDDCITYPVPFEVPGDGVGAD